MFNFSFFGNSDTEASESQGRPKPAAGRSSGAHRPSRSTILDDGGGRNRYREETYSDYTDDSSYNYSEDGPSNRYSKSALPKNYSNEGAENPNFYKQYHASPSFSGAKEHTIPQHAGVEPTGEEIRRIMKRMKHENRRNRYVQNCLVYGIFLTLLLCSQFLNWSIQSSYQMTETTREFLLREEFDEAQAHFRKDYSDVGHAEEFFQWLEGPFSGSVFNSSRYGTSIAAAQPTPKTVGLSNLIIGRLRIRQLRVAPQKCVWDYASTMPTLFQQSCYPEWSNKYESTEPFGGTTGTRWSWSDADATGTHPWQSTTTYYKYNAAGYVVDVTPDPNSWALAVAGLRADGFIDKQTRGIFVNVNFYNQNLDLYQSAQLLTEFTASGTLLNRDARVMTYRIDPWETGVDKFRMACSVLAMFFVLVYLVIWFRDLYMTAILDGFFAYFADFWVWLDFINLVCYIVAFFLRITFITLPLRQSLLTIEDRKQAEDQYINLEVLMGRVATINGFMALNIFISFCKSFKYLQVNPRLGFLWRVLQKAWPDLISFLLLFFIVFFGFACMGHILYGPYMFEWRTFWTSSFSLARMVFGDFDYNEMEIHHPTWTPVYFNLYMIIVYFIMINMFLAIMNDAFAIVNTSPAPPETAAIAKSWQKFKNRVKQIFGQHNEAEVVTRKMAERDIITRLAESGVLTKNKVTIEDLREALGADAPEQLAETIMTNYDKDNSGVLDKGELQALAPLADRYNVQIQRPRDDEDEILNARVKDTFQRRIVDLQRNLDDILRELDNGRIRFNQTHDRDDHRNIPMYDMEAGSASPRRDTMLHRRRTGHESS